MVATTRSRGSGIGLAYAPDNNNNSNDGNKDDLGNNAAVPKSTTTAKKDKVYRRTAPKAELQQLKFPARSKTVRPKKPANKRLSLPNPSTSTRKGKGRKKLSEDEEESNQRTLTQMNWVPSTYPSGDEQWDEDEHQDEKMPLGHLSVHDVGAEASGSKKKTSSALKRKKKPAAAKSTSKGRKRRKTTGDLELELEREDGDEQEVSSSRYHTQTLTQMPSWDPRAIVADSDEDPGFGPADDLLGEEERANGLSFTPESKKRKRPSPSRPPAGGLGPNEDAQSTTLAPDPEIKSGTAVLETPHRQRLERTEIPSSQPSPFTPNLDLAFGRFFSPLQARDSPLKERSTNANALVPTPSLVRKRTRSEVPDSLSTVNGGMPPSSGGSGQKRSPLKDITHFADYSAELGESSDRRSQRTGGDVIVDSDNEFEGFLDEDEVEASTVLDDGFEGFSEDEVEAPVMLTPQIRAPEQDGKEPTTESIRASQTPTQKSQSKDGPAEFVPSSQVEGRVASTPVEQITVPGAVTSEGLRAEPEAEAVPETPTPAPSTRIIASQPRTSRSNAHSSTVPASSAGVTGTPVPPSRNAPTQQPPSHAPAATQRKPTPAPSAGDDDTVADTPTRPRRRPSSSSAVDNMETPLSSPQKTSPTLPAVSQFVYTQAGYTQLGKSQAFESQRVPVEILRQMAPQTSRSDVMVSVDVAEVKRITTGSYTHLFRDFRLPATVARVWFYITAPVFQLKYMATISEFKMPGDVDPQLDLGIDIAEFAEGKRTKYAYELLQVYQLNDAVPLKKMKEDGWVEEAPGAHFAYVPPAPVGLLLGNLRCALLEYEEPSDESQSQEPDTESQELQHQLVSDIEHSTQLLRKQQAPSSPPNRSLQRHDEGERCSENPPISSSQSATEDRVPTGLKRTTFASTKEVVFAKPKTPHSRSQRVVDEIEDTPPTMRQSYSLSQQRVIKSTVRPSQATTMSAPSQSQREGEIEYHTIPDSSSPERRAASKASSLTMAVVDDSPIQMRGAGSSGRSSAAQNAHATQSSLGLGALLHSSQGLGLGDLEREQDSLLDDSRIKMPPAVEEVGGWDSDEDGLL